MVAVLNKCAGNCFSLIYFFNFMLFWQTAADCNAWSLLVSEFQRSAHGCIVIECDFFQLFAHIFRYFNKSSQAMNNPPLPYTWEEGLVRFQQILVQ